MMKKSVILFAICLIFSLTACGSNGGNISKGTGDESTGNGGNSIRDNEELKPYFAATDSANKSSYDVGDSFTLGNMDTLYIDWVFNEAGDEKTSTRHYQNADIEWTILDIKGSCATAISTYVLEEMNFEGDKELSLAENCDEEKNLNLSWKNCTIRQWLNSNFYLNAFTETEREAIVATYVKNKESSNLESLESAKGPSTIDKVYLLSVDEAYQYFPTDLDRAELVNTRGDAGDTLNYTMFRTVTVDDMDYHRAVCGLFRYNGDAPTLYENLSPYAPNGISPVISVDLNKL